MIVIKKGKTPKELIAHKKQKNASYDNMSKCIHGIILDSLMQEQGYLCAYCMSRIPQKRRPPVTIEHLDPQSKTNTTQALNYSNMVAVCNGNRGCGTKKNMTCDASRGNSNLTVNPLVPSTLSSIQYKPDGIIYSLNKDVNNDLNNILNLNSKRFFLVENRLKALQTMLEGINKHKKDRASFCLKLLKMYQSQSKKTPYVGILIWWLQKNIKS